MKRLAYLIFGLLLIGYFSGQDNDNSARLNPFTSNSIIQSEDPAPVKTDAAPFAIPAIPLDTSTNPEVLVSEVSTQLNSLLIKGRAPKTGYDRDNFGSAWSDIDRNGCDTRNDILSRDLTEVTYRVGTNNCVVESGNFYDPYSDIKLEFVKSSSGSTIEIDHIVSLSDSWQKGAQQWNSVTLKQFANDPLNLVAAERSVNRSKSDSDAASWLPPNKKIRCAFISRQVAVKSAYQLWVTQAEHDAMAQILSKCPNQPLASSGSLRP